MAFLHFFQAWEVFVEDSFILYLRGRIPPRGRAPKRYAFPPDNAAALSWVVPEGREYAEWAHAQTVRVRAERFFKAGRPFGPVLTANQTLLDHVRLIRNAIAHKSETARVKFERIVRDEMGTLPPTLTVGGFLSTTKPGTVPPISFLEFYAGRLELSARRIVPS